jgi:hypothetical protein
MPNFRQDLRNVGVTPDLLESLSRPPRAYVSLLERVHRVIANSRGSIRVRFYVGGCRSDWLVGARDNHADRLPLGDSRNHENLDRS